MTTATEPRWVRPFGSREYAWLWVAQVISALGDWIGLFAITALAAEISEAKEAAIALVLTARVAPSFVLGPLMGVLVDRYDRRTLMRIADLSRALVFMALPFVDSVAGLIVASLLLEVLTLLWSPAKEAMVPILVGREQLARANSLGVLAAYGTIPFAALIGIGLARGNDALARVDWLAPLGFRRNLGEAQALAFYFDAMTFAATAAIVTIFIRVAARPVRSTDEPEPRLGPAAALAAVREGWRFIAANPVVRAVNIGLAAGLLGGAMVVPLGPSFAKYVNGDASRFNLYIAALGFGVAVGVAGVTALQARLPKAEAFVVCLFIAGLGFGAGVSMPTFWWSAAGVGVLGLMAGAVYVLGYTLIQEHTEDELRGRTFTTFLTSVRLCVLGAMVLGPALATIVDPILRSSIHERANCAVDTPEVVCRVPVVRWFGVEYALPGVRVVLWLAALVILVAAVLAARSIKVRIREMLTPAQFVARVHGKENP